MPIPSPTEKQAKTLWFCVTALAVAVVLVLGGLLFWGLGVVVQRLAPVLLPLAIAGVIAYLLDPVVDFLESKGAPRVRAILCVFATAVFLVLGILANVVPQIVLETRQLITQLTNKNNIDQVKNRVDKWIDNPPSLIRLFLGESDSRNDGTNTVAKVDGATNALPGGTLTNLPAAATLTNTPTAGALTNVAAAPEADSQPQTLMPDQAVTEKGGPSELWRVALRSGTLKSAAGWFAETLPAVGVWLLQRASQMLSAFGFLAGLALVPVYAFFLLIEKKSIRTNWTDYLPVANSAFKNELVFVLRSINDHLISFFRGQVLVAICDGVLYTVGFLLIGLPYAVLLGAVATVLTLIPFLGSIVTFLAAFIIAWIHFGDWLHPLLSIIVFAVVQTLESLVISPKIMGDRMRLHPMTIIVAVMVGTILMGGILGGILAIPLTAALRVLMFRYIWRRPDEPTPAQEP